ncbi:hypothetical protein DFP72DRAFT_819607, partial [Ephemerocybe angulata]
LINGIRSCDKRRGETSTWTEKKASKERGLPYSEANHRAVVALRCAENQRPYNMVEDRLYKVEVEMLRPGTTPPKPATVSRDVQRLFIDMAVLVAQYFMVRPFLSIFKISSFLTSDCGHPVFI